MYVCLLTERCDVLAKRYLLAIDSPAFRDFKQTMFRSVTVAALFVWAAVKAGPRIPKLRLYPVTSVGGLVFAGQLESF